MRVPSCVAALVLPPKSHHETETPPCHPRRRRPRHAPRAGRAGTAPVRIRTRARARVLLKADESTDGPAWGDPRIAEVLEIDPATVGRVRTRFAQEGRDAALRHCPPRATKSPP